MEARQQSWPRMWLMTDERIGDRLWDTVGRLPDEAGIVFRHYSLPEQARVECALRLAEIAGRRGLTLAVAADVNLAMRVGARLVHNPPKPASGVPFSRSVHSLKEAEAANSAGAALVFVSPVFATRSHHGLAPLGPDQAAQIAGAAGVPAIALGGMNARNFAALKREGFYGWAGIDAWLRT